MGLGVGSDELWLNLIYHANHDVTVTPNLASRTQISPTQPTTVVDAHIRMHRHIDTFQQKVTEINADRLINSLHRVNP